MEIGDQSTVNGTIINIQGSAHQQMNVSGRFQQIVQGPVTQNISLNSSITINEILSQCNPEIMAFIQEFDDTLHDRLTSAKNSVFDYLINLDERERSLFFERYRYPYKHAHAVHTGVADLCKILILCHIAYEGWLLDNSYVTHNLLLQPDQWRRVVHSCWSHQSMPQIIIHLANYQKIHISSSNIFPHRLVIINSDQRKDNLCQHCGKESFPFERILRDYGRSSDRLIFRGTGYDNSYKALEKIEVYDGGCTIREAIEASDYDDLTLRVRKVL